MWVLAGPHFINARAAANTMIFMILVATEGQRHGDGGRKVWATEVGYATGSGTGQIAEEVSARYTAQTFDRWFALPYAGPLFWYELVDGHSYVTTDREQTFGLLHSGDWSEKPGYRFFLSKL